MKKIVVFGDSIAAGLYQGEQKRLLDYFMLQYLNRSEKKYEAINLGKKGDSTETASKRIVEILKENPEIVVVNVGINDAINIRNNILDYEKNIQKILTAVNDKQVIVLGPSYVNEQIKTQAKAEIIKSYNDKASLCAANNQATFIDVYQHFSDFETPNDFLQTDGLHPSMLGYHLLGSLVAQIIDK